MHTTFWKNSILTKMYLSGNDFYVGLSSTLPDKNGIGVSEPSVADYRRMKIRFSEPVEGRIYNSESIRFPTSTSIWFSDNHPAKYYVIFDGSGADAHVLSIETMVPKRGIDYDVTIVVPAETISIQIAE